MAHGLVADKPLLYFGFRPLDVNSEDVIGFINKTDFDVTISCRVWPTTATAYFQVGQEKHWFLVSKNICMRKTERAILRAIFLFFVLASG